MLLLLSLFLSPLNDNFNVSKPKTETGVRHNTTHTQCVCKVSKLVTFIWLLPALCCPLSFFLFPSFPPKVFFVPFSFCSGFDLSPRRARVEGKPKAMEWREKEKRKRLPACWQNALCWGIATAADWSHAFDFSLKALGPLFFPLAGS